MSQSSSQSSGGSCPVQWSSSMVTLAATAVASAAATYLVTMKREKEKQRKLRYQQYQQEKDYQEQVRKARKLQQKTNKVPLTGTVQEGISIEKVFVWKLQDLRLKFPSAKVPNCMKMIANNHVASGIRSPALLQRALSTDSSSSAAASPLRPASEGSGKAHEQAYNKLITDDQVILADIVRKVKMAPYTIGYMRAGPRELLHFDPKKVNAAIVTCGGLCPGLNNVIREITKTLYQIYGIGGKVYGVQGGYNGFHVGASEHMQPVLLTPEVVEEIHHQGGTALGSSRGGFDLDKILEFLRVYDIQQLYVIGGDGTHRGAFRIHEGCMEAGMNVAVAGIPKTIDNDVDYIDHSFGFSSAVEAAQVAIRAAKTEAVCNLPNGIGIVKLMGRSAGFIAAHATMASSDVDLCLIPEVPIVLEGPNGCLPHLMRRVKQQGYAVIVCAEGAGEELLGESAEKDASGNKKLPAIGEYLKKVVVEYFAKHGEEATVKYIDPSYTVRSVPANAADSLYCMQLAQNAVHGAMAGFTGFSVGLCNNRMVWLPIPELCATSPRSMNPRGRTWERILTLTRQPNTVEPLEPGEMDTYDSHAPMLR